MKMPALLLAAILAAPTLADTKIVEVRRTEASEVMGHSEPAREETVTLWLGEDRLRTDLGKKVMLIRLDEQRFYILHPEERRYSVTDLPISLKNIVPDPMWPMIEPMIDRMKIEVHVTPGSETKKISGFDCRRYDMEMSSATFKAHSVIWASEQIPLPAAATRMLTATLFVMQTELDRLVEEMSKIRGYRVYQETVTEYMGSKSRTIEEVRSVEQLDPPAGLYSVPEGYQGGPLTLESMTDAP
ncbi:MAG: DUF4412 domain-containing protein [Acidobacteriota bacterium]|nr:DUF4412 domain-containing protein [Acidobacteriota bacterium]MDQ7088811.1 DUF4412 domain-containing protein [Acidobacteriota bacterium]